MKKLLQPTNILVSTNAAGKCPEELPNFPTCNLTTVLSGPQYDG